MIVIDTKEQNKKLTLELDKEALILSVNDKTLKSKPKYHLTPENVKNLIYWLNRYQERANIENEFKPE